MSVELIDNVDDAASTSTNPQEEEVTLDSVVTPVQETQPEPAPEQTPEPSIPDKYQGKSIEDLVDMHQNAEKMIGRSSNEVGELRRIVDDFISTQSQSTQQEPQEEEVDFFADPEKAVKSVLANDPDLKEAKQASEAIKAHRRAEEAEKALLNMHPDANDILASPEFQKRLEKSPLMQKAMADAAASQDAQAMSVVFEEYKATSSSVQQAQQNNATTRQEQAKQASTGAVKSGAGDSRKLYRRADIIDLMVNEPDRYQRLLPEIEAAYREKRVIT